MTARKPDAVDEISPKHQCVLDEDGRCRICSTNEWIEDDIRAKRETTVPDDTESHGPEH